MFKHKQFILSLSLLFVSFGAYAQQTIYEIGWGATIRLTGSGCTRTNVNARVQVVGSTPEYTYSFGGQYAATDGQYHIYSSTRPISITLGGHTSNSMDFTIDENGNGKAYNVIEPTREDCMRVGSTLNAGYTTIQVVIANDNLKPAYCPAETFNLGLPGSPSSVVWKLNVNGRGAVNYRTGGKTLAVNFQEISAFVSAMGINPSGANLIFSATAQYGQISVDVPSAPGFSYSADIPRPTTITTSVPACFNQNGTVNFNDIRTANGQPFTGSPVFYIKLENRATGAVTNVMIDRANLSVSMPVGEYNAIAVERSTDTENSTPCIWKYGGVVKIDPAAEIMPFTQLTCVNGAPAVTLSATGGKGPHNFSLGGTVNPANNTFTGLNPGTLYTFTVTDANGCVKNIQVTTPAAVALSRTGLVAPSGTNANGSITVAASGGAGPYEYSLNGTNWQQSNVFNGLAAGNYRLYARDSRGCISPVTLDVTLQALDFTFTTTGASCSDIADGQISVAVTGGAAPYSYRLNNDAYRRDQAVFTQLSGGNYNIWVQDANGVTLNKPAVIAAPAPLVITAVNVTDVICRDMSDGSITVNAGGGNGGYTYYINNSLPRQTSTFPVSAGVYTMRVDDSKGCSVTAPAVTVTQPPLKVAVTPQVKDVACFGTATGVITLAGSNGTAPYSYSLEGGTWQPNESFTVQQGTYTLAVRDAKGCENTVTNVLVRQPALLTVQQDAITPVSCNGFTDGRITVSANGGTGTVRYYINTAPLVPTNGTFTGLAAGTYTITAKDDNGCAASVVATVIEPAIITAQASSIDVLCYGQSNGSVRVDNVAGGNGGYTYAIDNVNFNNNARFENLPANSYTIYIKDQKDCRAQAVATVSQLTAIDFTAAAYPALCNGGATGRIEIVASGGTGTYTYSLDGSIFDANAVITGLTAGSKSITVKDGNACQLSKSFLIEQPAPLILSLTNAVKVSCFGGNNGSLTVIATGGTAPFEYAINNGAYQSSGLFEQLTAGTYHITVRDGNRCTTSLDETVAQFSSIGIEAINTTDILCAGTSTGAINLSANGGAGGYTFDFNNAGYRSESNWTSLPAANYQLHIKDINGCTAGFVLPVKELYAPLHVDITSNPPATCEDRGAIIINSTSGGLQPYAYSLDDVQYTTETTFGQLLNGDYTVYIRDVNGCTITRTLSPYGPVTIRGRVTATDVSCKNGSNGTLTVADVSGGNNTYEYSVDGINFQSSPLFSGLKAGVYPVQIRDVPYTCRIVINTPVNEPTQLTPALTNRVHVKCFGEANGQLTIGATGGVLPYVWSIDGANYQSASTFEALTAGNYTTYVKDANGCITMLPLTINQPDILAARVSEQSEPACYGDANGRIALTAIGGTQPYTYQVNNEVRTAPVFGGLIQGSYNLKVTDIQGCQVTLSTDLHQPAAFKLAVASLEDVSCFGRSEGVITLAADGGTLPYSYTLNNLPPQNTPVFQHLPAGEYLLQAKDAHGCAGNLAPRINQPALLTYTKTVHQPVCSYSEDGAVTVTMNGGTLPYTYNWSNGAVTAGVEKLNGGTYAVVMKDAKGCELSDQTIITMPEAILVNLGFRDTVLCVGQQLHLSAGNPGKTYLWQSDAGFTSVSQQATVGETGNYTLKVTDQYGCFTETPFSLTTSLEALTAEFLVSTYNAVGDTVVIMDVSRPKPVSVTWSLPADGRDAGSNADGSIRQMIFDQPGTYRIDLVARLGECAASSSKEITILPKEQQADIDSLIGYRESLIKDVVVSPNPASSQFKVDIKLSKTADVQVRVISFNNGQVVDMKQSGGADKYQVSFDAERLQQGIYLIGIQVKDEYIVRKLLKI
ncbi:T9SS type A sorting domain-containing protein [Chitinophaga rhizophila]|uniref:T9SS type A sorting domain-containing protein n=1 Tax=Chitinophaga rhizophila TaxID=2866212 RepID=A0ABS7GK22_9BACT|nr:T9SS type A sorting domain-containing protein [Chitinophaga rhizophila]MBW8687741.1 T9SS type A sorting domain-containing protein [Chitinophaga rhizophila]